MEELYKPLEWSEDNVKAAIKEVEPYISELVFKVKHKMNNPNIIDNILHTVNIEKMRTYGEYTYTPLDFNSCDAAMMEIRKLKSGDLETHKYYPKINPDNKFLKGTLATVVDDILINKFKNYNYERLNKFLNKLVLYRYKFLEEPNIEFYEITDRMIDITEWYKSNYDIIKYDIIIELEKECKKLNKKYPNKLHHIDTTIFDIVYYEEI